MLFIEKCILIPDNHKKRINTVCRKDVCLLMKVLLISKLSVML